VTVRSEDASVNTGAAGWPSYGQAFVAVRRIQNKLHCWAAADRGRRFDDLYNLVWDPTVLTLAWERVAGNMGARTAGVDRATVAWIVSRYGVETFLHEVRDQLRSRTFTPAPVRQVMIPKASGKLRALGIPTVIDRVVQAALKLILEPIFEADFAPVSYGFRPSRRAQDAIAEIHHFTTQSYQWVLEADIEACFDNIDHAALMDRLRTRIKDKRVLALVKSFLKAGVLTATGSREGSITGTPQGGILSPLLANIALSVLDDHFIQQWQTTMAIEQQRQKRRRQGLANYRLIRYADDFVVLVTGEQEQAQALRVEVATVLAPMGLRLSPEKTQVVHIDNGFDFLGFNIRRMRKRGSHKRYVYTRPSAKAIASIKERIRTLTYRHTLHRTATPVTSWNTWAKCCVAGRTTSDTVSPKPPSTRSTPIPGSGSRTGCGRSTGSAGQNSGAGSACPAPGAWPTTGNGSVAPPLSRSFGTATAATASRPRGPPSNPSA
jgi:RNA-directed DNA polymerase